MSKILGGDLGEDDLSLKHLRSLAKSPPRGTQRSHFLWGRVAHSRPSAWSRRVPCTRGDMRAERGLSELTWIGSLSRFDSESHP